MVRLNTLTRDRSFPCPDTCTIIESNNQLEIWASPLGRHHAIIGTIQACEQEGIGRNAPGIESIRTSIEAAVSRRQSEDKRWIYCVSWQDVLLLDPQFRFLNTQACNIPVPSFFESKRTDVRLLRSKNIENDKVDGCLGNVQTCCGEDGQVEDDIEGIDEQREDNAPPTKS